MVFGLMKVNSQAQDVPELAHQGIFQLSPSLKPYGFKLTLRRPKQHRSHAPDVRDLTQTVKPWSDPFKIFTFKV